MAKVVANPIVGLAIKATQIMIQSIMLWTMSPTKFIHAKVFTSWVSLLERIVFNIFSIKNPIMIHHIKDEETNMENQYSSTASGKRCKNASHINIPAEKAINQTNIFLSLARGYHRVIIQIIETKLTTNTANIQYM